MADADGVVARALSVGAIEPVFAYVVPCSKQKVQP